jgi:putative MATE family efflux protein
MDLSKKRIRINIWKLAWPAILRMAFQTSVGIVTLILVGNYFMGAKAVAAIGLAQRVMFLIIGMMSALGVGTTALVAHHYGAGAKEKIRIVVSQSILIAIAGAVVLALFLDKFGPTMLRLMMLDNPDMEIIAIGSSYLRIVGYSMIIGLIMMIINSALQGMGDMKTPMYFTIGMNLLNITLGVILIPSLGLTGAGLAEGISRAAGGIFALVLLLKGRLVFKISTKDLLQWQPKVVKEILRIGLPSAGEQFVRQSSQIIYTVLIASLGTVAIAANQVVMTIQSISFMPGFGFGVAATTFVGQALGAQKPEDAEKYGYETNNFAMVFMGLMGVIFFIWARPLAQIFVPDAQVVELAATCLKIVAFAQIPTSAVMVLNGGLRGAGDTRWVMYVTVFGQWGIRLGLSLLMIRAGMGLVGVWIAMAADMTIRSVLVLYHYRSGRWKEVFKIESAGATDPQPSR